MVNLEKILEPTENDSKATEGFKMAMLKKITRQIKYLEGVRAAKEILELMQSQTYENGNPVFAVDAEKLNKKPWLRPCDGSGGEAGVVVDIRTGREMTPNQDDLLTIAIKTQFKGLDAPAPRWRQFLEDCHPDRPEVIEFLQICAGYALLGNPKNALFLVLLGLLARNGKSRYVRAITVTLGYDLCVTVKPETIMKFITGGAGGIDVALAETAGKCFMFMLEPDRNAVFSDGLVKTLVGGDIVSVRRPYETRLTNFEMSAVPVLACNDLPRFQGDDPGLINRIKIVDWPVHFVTDPDIEPDPSKNQRRGDPDLDRALELESSGILAWIVEGAVKYTAHGLHTPDSVRKRTASLIAEKDLIGIWINENISVGVGETERKVLFQNFLEWQASSHTGKPWTRNSFYDGLRRKVPEIKPRRQSGVYHRCRFVQIM